MMTTTQKREFGFGTSMTVRYPWGINVTARVMCPDGKVRAVHHIAETADTFFSVPASVCVSRNGKRYVVSGYVTMSHPSGLSTVQDDQVYVEFRAVDTSKHADLIFPRVPFIKRDELEFAAKYQTTAVAKLERF